MGSGGEIRELAASAVAAAAQTVAPPSSSFETYVDGELIRLSVPSNWRELPGSNTVTFAPEAAYGNAGVKSVFTHGVAMGLARNDKRNLRSTTNGFIELYVAFNSVPVPTIRYRSVRIGSRRGLHTVLSRVSEATGGPERIGIYTTVLADGTLFYVLAVAPGDDEHAYEATFRRVMASIQSWTQLVRALANRRADATDDADGTPGAEWTSSYGGCPILNNTEYWIAAESVYAVFGQVSRLALAHHASAVRPERIPSGLRPLAPAPARGRSVCSGRPAQESAHRRSFELTMFDWLKQRGTIAAAPTLASPVAREARVNAGEYQLLYKYLRDRFANRLVLTFAEIEDLVGFSLPAGARVEDTWWSATIGPRSAQSKAWTLAGRTATVNLMAQCVVFERET